MNRPLKLIVAARLIVAASVLALTTAPGTALATPPTPAGGPIWAPNQSVKFRWKEDSMPPNWARGAITDAVAASNVSRAARAAFLTQQDGADSWIGYSTDIPGAYAIAYTVAHQPTWFHVRMRPQGYVLDWGTLRWCQFYQDPPQGCYDAELVTLHELGHVQTLDHPDEGDVTDWLDTIMHAAVKSKARTGWNAHAYGRCDVARLQIIYRALTSSTPYSTCLSLPTELSLSASSFVVESGNSVTFTARLKVADDAIYPNLAGQPASGRIVRIQRRAPGATAWTTVADMAPADDTGGYVKALSVTATYDWRAIFPTPTEGLQGSSSGTLRVSTYPACQPAGTSAWRIAPRYVIC